MSIDETKLQSMIFDATRDFEITEDASREIAAMMRDGMEMSGYEFGNILAAVTECAHCSGLAAQLIAHMFTHGTLDGGTDAEAVGDE